MPNKRLQTALLAIINDMDYDSDITTTMFRDLSGGHLSVVNKALRSLEAQGHIEFSHSQPTPWHGGAPLKVWRRRPEGAFKGFCLGAITKGVFAHLFERPKPIVGGRQHLRLSAGGDHNDL